MTAPVVEADYSGSFPYTFPFVLGPVYRIEASTEIIVSLSAQARVGSRAGAALAIVADNLSGAQLAATSGTGITALTAAPDALARLQAVALAQLTATASVPTTGRISALGAAELNLLATCVPEGHLLIFADTTLAALATPTATGAFLHWGNAELLATATALTTFRLSARANAPLAVVALAQLTLINRHAGGNPMWLTFFYAGEGQRTL